MASPLLVLDRKDWIRVLIVTAIAAGLSATGTVVSGMLQTRSFSFGPGDLFFILGTSLQAGIAYAVKNLATDSEGKVLGKY